ncbi:MAG: inorganic phosphate transporter [Bacteroidetes bacterium]|nr:inorganic phosphate transporter [Bacteroidota bacterium]
MGILFITSGLFLGWSLGANDAANVFGTAVGSRMVKFITAAVVASIFVIIGAVVQGSGTTGTLGELGSVNALAGSFTVALSAAITVFAMTRQTIPVSSSQAIVGAIVGWNFYTGRTTDMTILTEIATSWVSGPVLGALTAVLLYLLVRRISNRISVHMLRLDLGIKIALILTGAFGAYSLGANNIANVVGVFVPSVHLQDVNLFGVIGLSGAQQLYFLGSLAIAVGIITYSRKIMMQVGHNLLPLNSVASIVVVLAHSLVLFLFSSLWLKELFNGWGLPYLPLVPVSSSQVIVGAILGIGLLKGGRGVKFRILGQIALGWILTPLITGLICYFALFFMENVFKQVVALP